MSGLTVKALRHDGEIGLLEPWQVNPDTGYRHDAPRQAQDAEAIRRLRSLDLPLDEVRGLVRADVRLLRERAGELGKSRNVFVERAR